MTVYLEFLDGPAAGTVRETGWSTALPSLYWADPDSSRPGVIYHRASSDPDPATGHWTYRVPPANTSLS